MTRLTQSLLLAATAAVLSLTPSVRADNLDNMDLVNPGNGNSAAGIYVGPYTGTINGGPNTPIICDDFTHDSFVGETWQATATNLGTGSLGNTLYGAGAATEYDEAAYLASELLAPSVNGTTQQALQYALWAVFYQNPASPNNYSNNLVLNYLASNDSSLLPAVEWDLQAAIAGGAAMTTAELANFTIYTAVQGTGMCGSTACSPSTPQEFIVETPEPSTLLLLGAGLLALAVMARRKKNTAGSLSIA